jgi:hypothetical protein
MRKLEVKHIAPYIPYRLKMQCGSAGIMELTEIYLSGRYKFYFHSSLNYKRKDFNYGVLIKKGYAGLGFPLSQVKPILRPLSDLYREITHNRKKIVPILKLAEMAYPGTDWYLADGGAEHDTGYDYIKFSFTEKDGSFSKSNGGVANQAALFDFLHELKIDFRGLIDDGLAIDCNTLDDNPYNNLHQWEKK